MDYLLVTLSILLATVEVIFCEQLRPLYPGDSYELINNIQLRHLGKCKIYYAWLLIPNGSFLDIHAHAAACHRLELDISESPDNENRKMKHRNREHDDLYILKVGEEINRIDQKFSAQLIDLENFGALLQAVVQENGRESRPPLTRDERLFYLANRIGQNNLLVILRNNREPKIEVIPPPSQKNQLLIPTNVLCYRRQCPSHSQPKSIIGYASESELNISLAVANKENHHIYMQLIIYRVVLSLSACLCLIFGIASLILCVRLRARQKNAPKYSLVNDLQNPCPMTSPSYYQLNTKVNYPPPSPIVFSDTFSLAHLPNDTASLQNTGMTNSFNGCDLMSANGNTGGNYVSYALPPVQGSGYNSNGSSMVRLVPMSSRTPTNNSRGFFVHYPNGSISPASASQLEMHAMDVFRAGSLGRNGQSAAESRLRRANQGPCSNILHPMGGARAPHTPPGQIRRLSQNSNSFRPVYLAKDTDQACTASGSTVVHHFPEETHSNYPSQSHNASPGDRQPFNIISTFSRE